MIAPRKNTASGPLLVDTDSRAALQRLAAPMRPGYGTWHTYKTEADALCAVISEIGEIVLARCIRVTVKGSKRDIMLTISNRHLVAISGGAINQQTDDAEVIANGIRETLAGASCLKFDIVLRNPSLPKASRSWSYKALMAAATNMTDPSGNHVPRKALLEAVKEMSYAWVDLATRTEAGDRDTLVILHQVATKRLAMSHDQVRISHEKSQITMIAIEDTSFCIEIELGEEVLITFCDACHQPSLVHLWRSYLATLV